MDDLASHPDNLWRYYAGYWMRWQDEHPASWDDAYLPLIGAQSQIARLVQPSDRGGVRVTASDSRSVAIGRDFSGGGSILTGDYNTQVRDITGSQGVVFGSDSANVTQSSQFDRKALAAALMDLYAALGTAQLPPRTQLQAQAVAGAAALEADPGSGEVDSKAVVDKVKQIGTTLQETRAVIDKGSSLWEKVQGATQWKRSAGRSRPCWTGRVAQ